MMMLLQILNWVWSRTRSALHALARSSSRLILHKRGRNGRKGGVLWATDLVYIMRLMVIKAYCPTQG
jgi:hypothetical protein